jgi:CDP-diacylglycerol--glycerol-3-phosphate 3-phosphatidyltransferase
MKMRGVFAPRRGSRWMPNAVSLFRLSLVFPFLLFIHDIIVYDCTNLFSLIIFVSIILSDMLDGYLARRLNCASPLGARLGIFSDTLYSLSLPTIKLSRYGFRLLW